MQTRYLFHATQALSDPSDTDAPCQQWRDSCTWLEDALFSNGYYPQMETYSIASALATILVAFPIYLLVSRAVVSEERQHPEKLDSPVRKWLTYMALVIAAAVRPDCSADDTLARRTYFAICCQSIRGPGYLGRRVLLNGWRNCIN